jgi:FixJ family two-component response regulator
MSGLELRRRLTACGSQLPIIFITAVDDEAVHKEAMEAGCVAYLRKPFPSTKLIGAINQATGQL